MIRPRPAEDFKVELATVVVADGARRIRGAFMLLLAHGEDRSVDRSAEQGSSPERPLITSEAEKGGEDS